VQDAVQSKLKKRSDLRDEKVRLVHLFMIRFNIPHIDLPALTSQDLRVSYSPRIATPNCVTRRAIFT
jgi:hypothetical protein